MSGGLDVGMAQLRGCKEAAAAGRTREGRLEDVSSAKGCTSGQEEGRRVLEQKDSLGQSVVAESGHRTLIQ